MNKLYEQYITPLTEFLLFKIPPGPRFIPACYVVNTFKGLTLPLCFLLMYHFNNFNTSAYLITALHGSYGLLWCLKHFILPDRFWWTKITLISSFVLGGGLVAYWSALYIVISQNVQITPLRMFVAIFMYVNGVVLMMASDTQKYFVLKVKKGLIQDGWFATCRNTNYLGEMLLYLSFAVVSKSWIPVIIDCTVWSLVFVGRWSQKEESFSKKEGGAEYIRRSSIILPFPLFGSSASNEDKKE